MIYPIYIKIAEDIKYKIKSGDLNSGDYLPSEASLCKEYDTSRMTVRKGLSILSNEGYIYSVPGKGYFVKKPESNKYTVHYNEMDNLINNVDNAKLLSVDIINPDEELANKLQISENKKIIKIRRLFYTDSQPIAYDTKYFMYEKGIPIVENEIEQATFPEMMSKNISPYELKKEIMIYAVVPGDKTKKLLKMYNELALLVVEQKVCDDRGRPMGLGKTYFRSDYIKLQGFSQ
jgi:GntR family transcriptional regulator